MIENLNDDTVVSRVYNRIELYLLIDLLLEKYKDVINTKGRIISGNYEPTSDEIQLLFDSIYQHIFSIQEANELRNERLEEGRRYMEFVRFQEQYKKEN